ncbi:hypothetical protein KIN20_000596 [Parelaphostrongylus tenuis]|uniref:Uncharacterized protein n=1 Tax=Parelaphostrongylus tenuis TaxID=148309 RepID=A0AAD5LVQ9_PARTN|nr:hypothetical protein KIN20_000596 [Parelaphostrongylus tenuis]
MEGNDGEPPDVNAAPFYHREPCCEVAVLRSRTKNRQTKQRLLMLSSSVEQISRHGRPFFVLWIFKGEQSTRLISFDQYEDTETLVD